MYVSGKLGKDYLNLEEFKNEKISVYFQDYKINEYQQSSREFYPALSVIDALMNNGWEKTRKIIEVFLFIWLKGQNEKSEPGTKNLISKMPLELLFSVFSSFEVFNKLTYNSIGVCVSEDFEPDFVQEALCFPKNFCSINEKAEADFQSQPWIFHLQRMDQRRKGLRNFFFNPTLHDGSNKPKKRMKDDKRPAEESPSLKLSFK